jgi:hypothetical protein
MSVQWFVRLPCPAGRKAVRMNRLLLVAGLTLLGTAREPPRRGPGTEKRFPPLNLPPGFKAPLFAGVPLIEYPPVPAQGPRPGSMFMASEQMPRTFK